MGLRERRWTSGSACRSQRKLDQIGRTSAEINQQDGGMRADFGGTLANNGRARAKLYRIRVKFNPKRFHLVASGPASTGIGPTLVEIAQCRWDAGQIWTNTCRMWSNSPKSGEQGTSKNEVSENPGGRESLNISDHRKANASAPLELRRLAVGGISGRATPPRFGCVWAQSAPSAQWGWVAGRREQGLFGSLTGNETSRRGVRRKMVLRFAEGAKSVTRKGRFGGTLCRKRPDFRQRNPKEPRSRLGAACPAPP